MKVAEVKHIGPFAVIMRHGAAEVHIKHSVHASKHSCITIQYLL